MANAAWELSIGQSVGNPNVRNQWETDELFELYSCKVIGNEEEMRQSVDQVFDQEEYKVAIEKWGVKE